MASVRLERRQHVAMVVENLPVPFDRRVWLEATTLQEHGYEVSVVCPTGKGYDTAYEVLDGIHVYRHPTPRETGSKIDYLREYVSALAWEARLLAKIARRRKVDAVHICNPPDLLFIVASWFKFVHRSKVVFDHHDVNPELYVEKFGRRDVFYQGLRLAERLTFLLSDVVISTNESYRRVALTRGKKEPDDVFVVRSAPDITTFKRVDSDPSHRRGRTYAVGYVGVMAEQDGVELLVRSVAILVHERGLDVQLQLIGGGPSLPALRTLVAELSLEDHVEFAGFEQGTALLRRLSSCDVGACPDPPTEYNSMCTMNKVLEYMAIGLPVVQFDLREGRASAGEAAIYAAGSDEVAFADAMEAVLRDRSLRAAMGRVGQQRMREQLGWQHSVPALLAAYERVWVR